MKVKTRNLMAGAQIKLQKAPSLSKMSLRKHQKVMIKNTLIFATQTKTN